MSIREARLCDSDKCNNPAKESCALCTLDRCAEHLGNQYVTLVVAVSSVGSPVANEFLGKCPAAPVCVACRQLLTVLTTGIHVDVDKMPLSGLVTPMRGQLIEAVAALLAEKTLAKK